MRLEFQEGQLEPPELIAALLDGQPQIIVACLLTLFISASLSTQDSNLIALSQAALYDVISIIIKNKVQPTVCWARFIVLSGTILSVILLYAYIWLFIFDIIIFLMTFFSCAIVLVPSII